MLAKPGAWLGVGVGGDEPPLRHSPGGKAEDGNCYTGEPPGILLKCKV